MFSVIEQALQVLQVMYEKKREKVKKRESKISHEDLEKHFKRIHFGSEEWDTCPVALYGLVGDSISQPKLGP